MPNTIEYDFTAALTMIRDLDRCEHGRHKGDVCSNCGGPSHGNPLADINVGYDIGGRAFTVEQLRNEVATKTQEALERERP